ncbi:Extradiol ring-cleavage dioxygenase, class III enzyme, subunit B [Podospora didyma]|uniref:Extradiol ring-cleavage dioxygenase, class III enzyme, subunit B n=1 Tax=Podospora didyma TaxID=330526 RepID=A0AAE0ND76_9PEZI|nr:Extradiol ring-cleavage dioxygenase, class III enzyme, subunit B [Podospora didyma]
MAINNAAKKPKTNTMAPVHLFSHGSAMMLGEDSASARYWKQCGDEALLNGVEHIVMMGAHWATTSPGGVLISANPRPNKAPVGLVHPDKYKPYILKPDLGFVPVIQEHLSAAGIASAPDPKFDWIHDTYLILIRMFSRGCPPTTIISMNASFDPHFHVAVGAALRPLRAFAAHKTLFIGSGGAVHNLFRNVWGPMLRHRDNFAQPTPPEAWALDFRQEVIDTFCSGEAGPMLRRKASSLMKHPRFRDAHGTDDHFIPVLFVAGLCGSQDDVNLKRVMGAEDWELTNMCNSQFTLGSWDDDE